MRDERRRGIGKCIGAQAELVAEKIISDGFAVVRKVLDRGTLLRARAVLDAALRTCTNNVSKGWERGGAGRHQVRKIRDIALSETFFLELAERRDLLLPVAAVLGGGGIRLHTSTVWMKPPGGEMKPPHQDAPHWLHVDPPLFVTCWVAIDDSTCDNGCLNFCRGSHRWGRLPHRRETDLVVMDFDTAGGVSVPLSAGDCTFHLGTTVHWSGPNLTESPRRGVAFAYMPSWVTIDGRGGPPSRYPIVGGGRVG
ncbi:phytanoyl-CoA dioxygenase family protein [Frankia sp. Cr2]|uniref:phytanoyl-CoA dioxygenase family protein n=1 Tax=Frankia sp. Cr2 TaxID=3073932 RepID=UPI002AD39824|nr:phytanoyl-CoA dioxygenase family protein [Frankia sp. Cr2]